MRLAIEIITGRMFHVEIGEEATVESLKKEIASKEGFQENRLILMKRSGALLKNDNCTLKDYGVCDGAIIYLFFAATEESKLPRSFESCVTFVVREG